MERLSGLAALIVLPLLALEVFHWYWVHVKVAFRQAQAPDLIVAHARVVLILCTAGILSLIGLVILV